MPLGLAIFLGVYGTWVGLNTAADNTEQAHPYWCADARDRYTDRSRIHYDVPGWRWLIPWPFRKGKARFDWKAGDKDLCTGETFNGKWWYKS